MAEIQISELESYFRLKFEDKLILKVPQQKDYHLNPATTILRKKQELAEIDEVLSKQKAEFRNKNTEFERRQQELDRKETQLKETLIKFDKFLKENDFKRSRALKKAAAERAAQMLKDKEIEKIRQEIELLNQTKLAKDIKVVRNRMYKNFLDDVISVSYDYSEVAELLGRHDLLVATLHDLIKRCEKAQEAIDLEKDKMSKFCEDKNNDILRYNNKLSEFLLNFDDIQAECSRWESVLIHIKSTSAKQTLILGTLKMSTHNVFQVLSAYKNQEVEVTSTFEQLTIIENVMLDLIAIAAEATKLDDAGSVTSLTNVAANSPTPRRKISTRRKN